MFLSCAKCFKQIKYKKNLIRHEKNCCTDENDTINRESSCPECNQIFGRIENLRLHVAEIHGINQESETIKFKAQKDFEEWKKQIEKESLCFYSKRRSYKLDNNKATRAYFYCHRTGYFKSESTGKRGIKSQGSNKIDGMCTSSLVVTENCSNITVLYHKTHYGHGSNLREVAVQNETLVQLENAIVKGKELKEVDETTRDVQDVLIKLEQIKGFIIKNKKEYSPEQWRGIKRAAETALNYATMRKKIKKCAASGNEPSN